MSARLKRPPRSRREERPAKLQAESARVSAAKADVRPKSSKAELRSERAAARVDAIERNASSIPPAAMHDVFDVRVPPPGRSVGSSLPPPLPPRGERRKRDRSAFARPAPHPPRPTKPPVAEPTAPTRPAEAAGESGVELSASEYEFASDAFGIPPLAAPRTDAPVELHVELPPERFDDVRPKRIPYRAIAVASAALMVVVIVAGLARPKAQKAAHATAELAQQQPLPAAEAALDTNAVLPAAAIANAPPAPDEPEAAASAASAADDTAPVDTAAAATGVASAILPPVSLRSAAPPGRAAAAFDTAAASSSITAAFSRASSCLKEGDPRHPATILLTYAPSGRVTTAVLSGPYSGTAVGGCIASSLRSARIPPFSGDYVTVKRTTVLK